MPVSINPGEGDTISVPLCMVYIVWEWYPYKVVFDLVEHT
jgi:hypothetical protein